MALDRAITPSVDTNQDEVQEYSTQHYEEQVVVDSEEIQPTTTSQTPTPLPFKTMCILCFVILAEPISMTILFPFIYFMVRDFGIADEKETGYYVGFIASSFSFAQFLTSVFWGWTSDRIGRRPVLLIGLIGNSVTNISFGLSKSLAWALTSRAACGFLNGNIGVAKCIMGEITDNSNKALAFSYMS
jgi:MFS family permease